MKENILVAKKTIKKKEEEEEKKTFNEIFNSR